MHDWTDVKWLPVNTEAQVGTEDRMNTEGVYLSAVRVLTSASLYVSANQRAELWKQDLELAR